MKVERTYNNYNLTNKYSYNINFKSGFKSPLDTVRTQGIIIDWLNKGKNAIPVAEYIERGALLLNLIKRMSGMEYINLTQKQKFILNQIVPDFVNDDVETNYAIAKLVKKYFEEKYNGLKDFTILAIGRSLASICETLYHMGADVRFLPMSGMKYFEQFNVTPDKMKRYRDYLNSIALTKDKIKQNQNRDYVIVDYTRSGRSLENAYKFLTNSELLGDSPNITTLGTDKIVDSLQEKFLYDDNLKKYSHIGYLQPCEFENVFKAANPYDYENPEWSFIATNKEIAKLFRLKLFEKLDKNNELNLL